MFISSWQHLINKRRTAPSCRRARIRLNLEVLEPRTTPAVFTVNTAAYGDGICTYHGALTVGGSTLSNNTASSKGGGIYGAVTVSNSSQITGNTAPVGSGADIDNLGVLYQDMSSIIGILNGNPAKPI